MIVGRTWLPLLLLVPAGCQSPPGPVFPQVQPPIVWPPPPDQPRIRYIGQLVGQSSVAVPASGWEAVREVVAGRRPQQEFIRPVAVAVAGERVLVADPGLGAVHVLDLAERRYSLSRGCPDDPLLSPLDVAALPDGRVLVVDRGRAALEVLDLDGNWQSTRRWAEVTAPVAACFDAEAGCVWVADAAKHACFAVAVDGGRASLPPPVPSLKGRGVAVGGELRRLGGRGGGLGQFNFPSDVTWRAGAGLVVVDAMNFRVQTFDEAGQAVAAFGQKGDAAGDFARPRSVAVDSQGHTYVVDNQFENVQVFDASGRLLLAFGEEGSGPGQFALPSGITIDHQDRIWIADSYNRRVQVFQYLSQEAACAAPR